MKKLLSTLALALTLVLPLSVSASTVTTTTLTNDTWEFGFNNDVKKQAQSWVANSTGVINSFVTNIARNGASSGNIRISIYTDSGGSPGTEISGQTVAGSTISAVPTHSDITWTPDSPVSVTNGTTYWLVQEVLFTPDGVNYYEIYGDAASANSLVWRKWASGAWTSAPNITARFSATISAASVTQPTFQAPFWW